jgi:hypothetical protein
MPCPFPRFDSFGPAEAVLHDIEAGIPHIFPDQSAHLVFILKQMVRHHSAAQGWRVVALNVSQGMPAEEINDLLENPPLHQGPLIIDPALLHPHENIYSGTDEIRTDAGRLTALNQASDDIIAVLYGIDGMDHHKAAQLIQARLRMMDMTFELMKADIARDPAYIAGRADMKAALQPLEQAHRLLGEVRLALNAKADLSPEFLLNIRDNIGILLGQHLDPVMRHNLQALDIQLQQTHRYFNPQPAPAFTPHTAAHTPHPEYDGLTPQPKPY